MPCSRCSGQCGCAFDNDVDGTSAPLGVGTAEDPIRVRLIDPSFVRPVARVKGATQTVPDSATTALTFNSEVLDTDGMVNLGGFPTRITFTREGFFAFGACAGRDTTNTPATVRLFIRKNGTTEILVPRQVMGEGDIETMAGGAVFAAGDYIELVVTAGAGDDPLFAALISEIIGGTFDPPAADSSIPVMWAMFLGRTA